MEVEPARQTLPVTFSAAGASAAASVGAVVTAAAGAAVVAAGSVFAPQAVMVSRAATDRIAARIFLVFIFVTSKLLCFWLQGYHTTAA